MKKQQHPSDMLYPGTEIDNSVPQFFMFCVVAGIAIAIGAYFMEKHMPAPCTTSQVQANETQQTPVQRK